MELLGLRQLTILTKHALIYIHVYVNIVPLASAQLKLVLLIPLMMVTIQALEIIVMMTCDELCIKNVRGRVSERNVPINRVCMYVYM